MQTWTKTLLTILVILVVGVGAVWYFRHSAVPAAAPVITATTTTSTGTSTPQLATYRSDRGGFTFQYDPSYQLREDTSGPYEGWPFTEQQAGTKSVTVIIPGSTQPKTNLVDGEFRVAYNRSSDAVKKCLTVDPNQNSPKPATTETINGVVFTRYQTTGAGAGNFYDTTSYRALHAGTCYAIDLLVHSGNIGNYPPEQGIREFDNAKVTGQLRAILATFKFL